MRFYYRWDSEARVRFLSSIVAVGTVWSFVLGVITFLAVPSGLGVRWALIAGCWSGLFLGVRSLGLSFVRVTGALRGYAVIMLGGSVVQATAEVLLVWRGWGPSGYMFGYALGAGVSMVVALLALGRYFEWRKISWQLSPELRSYAISVWPSVLFSRVLLVSDRLVVGRFGGLESLGLYGVASRLTMPIKLMTGSFKLALAPVLSKGEADGVDQYALIHRLGQFIVIAMLFIGSLLGVAVWFAHLTPWVAHSVDLQRMVALLLLAQYLSGLGFIGQTALYYSKKPHDASVSVAASATALIAGLALFVPWLGGVGAALAQVASGATAFFTVMAYERIRRRRFAPWHGFLGLVMLCIPAVSAAWLLGFSGQFGVLAATLVTYGGLMLMVGRRLSLRQLVQV
jgi:O-antigen/teichoic acid export membrane protein